MSDQTVTVTKDFTRERKEITFKLDDDIFYVQSKLATNKMLRYADEIKKFESGKPNEQLEAIYSLIRIVLVPESADRFIARMDGDVEPTIDIFEASDVIHWLLEAMGLRPTEPSEESSSGSDNPGSTTSSTDGVLETVSISTDSPSTAS